MHNLLCNIKCTICFNIKCTIFFVTSNAQFALQHQMHNFLCNIKCPICFVTSNVQFALSKLQYCFNVDFPIPVIMLSRVKTNWITSDLGRNFSYQLFLQESSLSWIGKNSTLNSFFQSRFWGSTWCPGIRVHTGGPVLDPEKTVYSEDIKKKFSKFHQNCIFFRVQVVNNLFMQFSSKFTTTLINKVEKTINSIIKCIICYLAHQQTLKLRQTQTPTT